MEDIEATAKSIIEVSPWLDWWLMAVCLLAKSLNPENAADPSSWGPSVGVYLGDISHSMEFILI